jgi:predicted SAM-dependent methyltransferase
MRQLLKKIPFFGRARRAAKRIRKAYNRRFGPSRLRKLLAASPRKKIVIGAADKYDAGWIPTDMDYLNLLQPADWSRFFQPNSLEAILAEHVWEHLTEEEGREAAKRCFEYLRPGGYLRVAVPDGLHPNPTYLDWVRPGGASPMQTANDHKVLYTYRTLRTLFEDSGFRVDLYEYFDEAGTFHDRDWNEKEGKIWRSKRFDKRNAGGDLTFTSIILDAVKGSAD